jgi:putative transposase
VNQKSQKSSKSSVRTCMPGAYYYVHHNPVHHGYVRRWQDWPWSSARQYLETVGPEEAKRIWLTYPILDYGKKWDI